MKKYIKNRRLWLISGLFIIASLILLTKLLLLKTVTFQVIETLPENSKKEVEVSTKITITFDNNIPEENWEIAPFPHFTFDKKINKNKIEIIPNTPLGEQTKYTIELLNSSYRQFYFAFSFTTKEEIVKKGAGDPNFFQNLENQALNYYPLIKHMPYKTKDWEIEYLAPKKIQVTFKTDAIQSRQEVLDWIRLKGVDPSTHEIVWKVQK